MKKSIPVRILTALGGLVLLALAVGAAAEGFGGVPVTETLGQLLATQTPLAVLCRIVCMLALAVLAVAAIVCAIPARKQKPSDYVMQKGENGPIGISVRAIEKLVRTCVKKHEVIANADIAIRETRDGVVILLDVDEVSGVSIPLTVDLLQRQIRQYVTGCTGIAVSEVRVMVENNTEQQVNSVFAVQDDVYQPAPQQPEAAPVETVRPQSMPVAEEPVYVPETVPAQEEPAPQPEAESEEIAPVVVELPVVLPEVVALPEEEADERPLHQRIFGAEEMPVTVPVPPQMTEEPVQEPAENVETEAAEEAAEPESIPETEESVPEEGEDWSAPDLQAAAEAVLSEAVLTEEIVPEGGETQAEEAAEDLPEQMI